jgi:L-ascorbate metabolism protein UlaG (beta-lactamase superfamily)
MRVRWYGHSAFAFGDTTTVFVDPFDAAELTRGRGFAYPPIVGVEAALVLVTHDHTDHNGVGAIGGDPQVVRAAGRTQTPIGEVIGIAGEHDAAAGTELGVNVIFVFECDGVHVCHFGDFAQAELRPEQQRAIGRPDLLCLPVGGGRPTIDGRTAAAIAKRLAPGVVVPMHYRTERLDWDDLETAAPFLAEFDPANVVRMETTEFDVHPRRPHEGTTVVLPALPRG